MKDEKHLKILRMVTLALLLAVELIMSLTPLGYLPLGFTSVSLLTIPVAIGAVTLGTRASGFLGGVFGLTSFLMCVFGKDPLGLLIYAISPWKAAVLCLLPRIVMGFAVGWIFRLLTKGNAHPTLAAAVTCGSAAVLNTVLFVESLLLLFGSEEEVLSFFKVGSVWGIVAALVTANALLELAAALLIGTPLARVLSRTDLRHRKRPAESDE